MKNGCTNCLWFGSCDGARRCEYYEPVEDGQASSENSEEKAEREAFRSEWGMYVNRDSDVDFTESAVRSCKGGHDNSKGGD